VRAWARVEVVHVACVRVEAACARVEAACVPVLRRQPRVEAAGVRVLGRWVLRRRWVLRWQRVGVAS
jgi:hypothetical protein